MQSFLASVLAALVLPTVTLAQALPATPPGQAAAAYLEVLETRDAAKAALFVRDRFPTAPGGGDDMIGFARQTGGFDLVRVETATPTVLTALVRERYGEMYARLQVETDAAAPHQIRRLGARVVPAPADIAPPARMNAPQLAEAVKAKLALMGEDFSGIVLLAHDGQTVLMHSQGWADRERRIANGPKTRFRLGSMDKMFTAIAVLQLAQAGKLDLQAPLITYLKDYPNADWASKVTLHQLLTHTGGAGDFFGPEYEANRERLRTLEDYLHLLGPRAPTAPPGTKREYANYGFIVLGRVVEVVSGQSYYDYVQARIFGPAGMTGSGFEPETAGVPDRAAAYERIARGFAPAQGLPWRGTSAGGGYATAEDFVKFAAAYGDGRLLDIRHRGLMTTAYAEEAGDGMGYGVVLYGGGAEPMIGHSGGAPGMSGDVLMTKDGKTVIVALSNVAPPFLAGRLTRFAAERLAQP